MKYSKIVLGGFISIAVFGIACNNNTTTVPVSTAKPAVTVSLSPSPAISGSSSPGFNAVATPRPSSSLIDAPPQEPSPFKTNPPFIIGKSSTMFGSSGTGTVVTPSASSPAASVVIVPSQIKGQVLGYDPTSKTYRPLSNAIVSIGEFTYKTDGGGNYQTSEIVSNLTDISAASAGFISSTVSNITPGETRDIHLQPLSGSPRFNENTITMEFTTLAGSSPKTVTVSTTDTTTTTTTTTTTVKEYPSEISFGSIDASRFILTLLDSSTGRYRLEVNPVAGKTTSQGQLLVYDIERDINGKPTNPTQMKSYLYRKDIVFRVGDSEFPSSTDKTTTATTTDSSSLITNFFNLNANFHDNFGFSTFTCNAYVVYPTGEKVLVSTYKGYPGNISFRLPKISDVSYSIEAHAGNATKGSDIVVRDLHEGDSIEAYLLEPPNSLKPDYNTLNAGTSPAFSWSASDESKGFQVEVSGTDVNEPFGWEGFTTGKSINYSSAIGSLKYSSQYRFQVFAMDFSFSGLNILNKADHLSARVVKNGNSTFLPFKLEMANHNTKTLPRGYRVSYDTVLFRAK